MRGEGGEGVYNLLGVPEDKRGALTQHSNLDKSLLLAGEERVIIRRPQDAELAHTLTTVSYVREVYNFYSF